MRSLANGSPPRFAPTTSHRRASTPPASRRQPPGAGPPSRLPSSPSCSTGSAECMPRSAQRSRSTAARTRCFSTQLPSRSPPWRRASRVSRTSRRPSSRPLRPCRISSTLSLRSKSGTPPSGSSYSLPWSPLVASQTRHASRSLSLCSTQGLCSRSWLLDRCSLRMPRTSSPRTGAQTRTHIRATPMPSSTASLRAFASRPSASRALRPRPISSSSRSRVCSPRL
eukprot:Amastigsp_a676751_23.p2 type:complete len:225 gc:universal Amastigsp_a676751_23:1767-1093(-)